MDWHDATLHPAFALKARRAFDGNWSVRTSHSGSPLLRTVSGQIESVDFSSARFAWERAPKLIPVSRP